MEEGNKRGACPSWIVEPQKKKKKKQKKKSKKKRKKRKTKKRKKTKKKRMKKKRLARIRKEEMEVYFNVLPRQSPSGTDMARCSVRCPQRAQIPAAQTRHCCARLLYFPLLLSIHY